MNYFDKSLRENERFMPTFINEEVYQMLDPWQQAYYEFHELPTETGRNYTGTKKPMYVPPFQWILKKALPPPVKSIRTLRGGKNLEGKFKMGNYDMTIGRRRKKSIVIDHENPVGFSNILRKQIGQERKFESETRKANIAKFKGEQRAAKNKSIAAQRKIQKTREKINTWPVHYINSSSPQIQYTKDPNPYPRFEGNPKYWEESRKIAEGKVIPFNPTPAYRKEREGKKAITMNGKTYWVDPGAVPNSKEQKKYAQAYKDMQQKTPSKTYLREKKRKAWTRAVDKFIPNPAEYNKNKYNRFGMHQLKTKEAKEAARKHFGKKLAKENQKARFFWLKRWLGGVRKENRKEKREAAAKKNADTIKRANAAVKAYDQKWRKKESPPPARAPSPAPYRKPLSEIDVQSTRLPTRSLGFRQVDPRSKPGYVPKKPGYFKY